MGTWLVPVPTQSAVPTVGDVVVGVSAVVVCGGVAVAVGVVEAIPVTWIPHPGGPTVAVVGVVDVVVAPGGAVAPGFPSTSNILK